MTKGYSCVGPTEDLVAYLNRLDYVTFYVSVGVNAAIAIVAVGSTIYFFAKLNNKDRPSFVTL